MKDNKPTEKESIINEAGLDPKVKSRLVPTGNLMCPIDFNKLANHDAFLEHIKKTRHEGDFNIYVDPITEVEYLRISGSEFMLLSEVEQLVEKLKAEARTKRLEANERTEGQRLKKNKIMEDRINALIAEDEYKRKVKVIDDKIKAVKDKEIEWCDKIKAIDKEIEWCNKKIVYKKKQKEINSKIAQVDKKIEQNNKEIDYKKKQITLSEKIVNITKSIDKLNKKQRR